MTQCDGEMNSLRHSLHHSSDINGNNSSSGICAQCRRCGRIVSQHTDIPLSHMNYDHQHHKQHHNNHHDKHHHHNNHTRNITIITIIITVRTSMATITSPLFLPRHLLLLLLLPIVVVHRERRPMTMPRRKSESWC